MTLLYMVCFQAEDGIRDLVRSRGLGDVYKRQSLDSRDAKVAVDRRPRSSASLGRRLPISPW